MKSSVVRITTAALEKTDAHTSTHPQDTTPGEPSALTPTEKTFDSGAHYEGSDSYE